MKNTLNLIKCSACKQLIEMGITICPNCHKYVIPVGRLICTDIETYRG